MNSESIKVNNKLYDPYYILGVTRDDSNDHITKTFRRKVKKYHPDKYIDPKDKKKYECYFKILVKSYEYIKERRESKRSIHLIDRKKNSHEVKEIKTCNKDEFDKEFEQGKDPNNYGYGEDYERMENIEDYEKLEINLVNLFGKKKFSNKQFNKIFEWVQYQESKQLDEPECKQLIHKTTDGFYAYNSGIINDSSALVSSYNGLMIVDDDLGERGIGYWGNNYSDYKIVHRGVKNPTKKPKIPKDFELKQKENSPKIIKKTLKIENFNDGKDVLYKRQYEDLLEKERLDKELVMKYIHKYKRDIQDAAFNNKLEKSQTYTDVLQKYIKE